MTSAPTALAHDQPAAGRVRRWIIEHEDSRAWVIAYFALALLLGTFVGTFWLVVVVALHGVFEFVRQHHADAHLAGVLARTAWELKLDAALVLFAIVLAVYMDVLFGLAGLGPAARLGARGAARFAAWQQALRAAALSADDALRIASGVVEGRRRLRGGDVVADEPPFDRLGGWRRRWGLGDRLSLGLAVTCLALIVAAPILIGQPVEAVFHTILEELRPLP